MNSKEEISFFQRTIILIKKITSIPLNSFDYPEKRAIFEKRNMQGQK